MLERVWRKGNPPTWLVGMQLVQPLWRTVRKFLKKTKIKLLYDPEILLLGIYLEKNIIPKDTHTQ